VAGSIDLAFGGFNDRIDRLELEAPAKRHWLMGPGGPSNQAWMAGVSNRINPFNRR
jgi:hypothetical protein